MNIGAAAVWVAVSCMYRVGWKQCLSVLRQNEKAPGASTGGNMGVEVTGGISQNYF